MKEYKLKIEYGEVYIDDEFVAQCCYDNESIGIAIGFWLDIKDGVRSEDGTWLNDDGSMKEE